MRTTITLEPDVAARLRDYAHRQRLSFKAAVDAVLRRGLSTQERERDALPPFVVRPHSAAFRPGTDVARLNQLIDQLEADRFVEKTRDSR